MFHNLRDSNGRFTSKKEIRNKKPARKKRLSASKKDMYVGLVLDESGSMNSVKRSTENGYNEYIQTMLDDKAQVNTYCTLVRFRSKTDIRIPYVNQALSDSLKLTDYQPSGSTPLYDSIAKCIRSIEEFAKKGDAVSIIIFTDGEENASQEFDKFQQGEKRIKQLITDKRDKEGWMISFVGCGEESAIKKAAESIGIFASNTLSYKDNTDKNINLTFKKMSASNVSYRTAFSKTGLTDNIGFFESTEN